MSVAETPATLVPHSGSMCLLDHIASWNEERVCCTSTSHRRPDHPLRHDGILEAVHLIEYAAQATAVHGALAARAEGVDRPARYLVAARDVELHVARLDQVQAELRIDAERLVVMGESVIYRFRVTADERLLCKGRLTIAPPGGRPS